MHLVLTSHLGDKLIDQPSKEKLVDTLVVANLELSNEGHNAHGKGDGRSIFLFQFGP